MRSIIPIFMLSMGLAGCALGTSYQIATESWVGAPIEEIIAAWGNPEATEALPDGERLYRWSETMWEGPDPSQLAALMAADPAAPYSSFYTTYICRREIISDSNGRIRTAWNSYDCWRSDHLPAARSRPGIE